MIYDEVRQVGGKRVSIAREHILGRKRAGEPIVMLTCYDYPTATMEDEAGVDVIFVGDSVGTNVLGYESETQVTMADMVHHLRAVRRGVKHAFLLVDMPHRSFTAPEIAITNARILMQAGADGVKLEGGKDQVGVVRALVAAGFDVCGHIGYTPQTLARSGRKGQVHGKTVEGARELIESADALEAAGVFMLVLELVTAPVARIISRRLQVPTIGIGSGPHCDGQVLVVHDLLGMSPITRKITQPYAEFRVQAVDAFRRYAADVKTRRFPTSAHAFGTDPELAASLEATFGVGPNL